MSTFVRPFVAFLACVSIVAATVIVGVGQADARNDRTLTSDFFDCSGPPGTPSSFTAVRDEQSSGSFQLIDGSAIFVALIFEDVTTGTAFSPPGLSASGNVTITCTVISPISGDTLLISGFLAPVH